MNLSAPVFRLKRKARQLARRKKIPLHEALDRVASMEGFRNWAHLSSHFGQKGPEAALFDVLEPGEMLVLAARPGQGKTVLGLQLLVEAASRGNAAAFFSTECTLLEVRDTLFETGANKKAVATIEISLPDTLSAETVIACLANAPEGATAVIDYLQVLDQQRAAPELADQVAMLKGFASDRGVRLVFLSQVHRSFDPADKPLPELTDIRLTNPVDLSLFDKGCFLHDGELALRPI